MTNNIDYNQLLQKPIAMMTGEELTFLIKNCASNNNPSPTILQQKNYGKFIWVYPARYRFF